MDDPGSAAGQNTCQKREGKGSGRRKALYDEPCGESCSQREGSIHGKIRKIQNFICDIDSESHDRIDQALL